MNADAVGMDLGGELSAPLAAVAQKRHISPFAMGLLGTRAVESMPAMAKAAAQSGTRNGGKLTQAQLDARAQQRTEADEVMSERINAAMDKLTPRERTVFELKHYQGLKLRTIGEMLNTTEETAKNTLFRATRKLRANLSELRS